MRILCISPVFVPRADPEAFCGGKMVSALRDAGVDVTVLTDPPSEPWHILDVSPRWQSLERATCRVDAPPSRKERLSASAKLRAAWSRVSYRTPVYARLIDRYVASSRKLHKIRPFDAVYSRSLPMLSHVIGYWCSRKLGLPWIVNINDPWDAHLFPEEFYDVNVSIMYDIYSKYWLRRTLRSAQLVTYPSARLHVFHEELSGIRHDGFVVSHVGETRNTCSDHKNATFTLVHAGRLIEGRKALFILEGIASFLEKFPAARTCTKLVFVGQQSENSTTLIARHGLESVVDFLGRVPYDTSLEAISSANVCVLIERPMSNGIYFPSKLADYIAAGKPVLALSPSVGVVGDLASEPGIRRVDSQDPLAIATAVGEYYREFQAGRLQDHTPSEALRRWVSPETVAHRFIVAAEGAIRDFRDASNTGIPLSKEPCSLLNSANGREGKCGPC